MGFRLQSAASNAKSVKATPAGRAVPLPWVAEIVRLTLYVKSCLVKMFTGTEHCSHDL